MTSPTPPSSASRPGNRRLVAATALLVAALATYAALRTPTVRVQLCTIGSGQLVANVVGTDTLYPVDSALVARMDSASVAGLHVVTACDALDRDTTAAHHAALARLDSLMHADSLKWLAGNVAGISTNADYWRVTLGEPGAASTPAPP